MWLNISAWVGVGKGVRGREEDGTGNIGHTREEGEEDQERIEAIGEILCERRKA